MAFSKLNIAPWVLVVLLIFVFAAGVIGASWYYEGQIKLEACISRCDLDTAGDITLPPSHCAKVCTNQL